MKTFTIAALLVAATTATALAAGKDPEGDRETVLRICLNKASFTEANTLDEYEAVRYSKPNHFYFGSKVWLSSGSDLAKARPCMDAVGVK